MKFDKSILREADIRGVYPTQINGLFARRLGSVFGSYVKRLGRDTVIVGHDNRFGGPDLTKNLIEGLINTGVDVVYIGLVTTPMLNYAAHQTGLEYGIMVTASHNPKEDNGFKLFGKNYLHCDYDELDIIYNALSDDSFKLETGHGTIKYLDVSDSYAKFMASSINSYNSDIKVVVDCGNGTGSVIIKKIYERLPFRTTFLFCDSNPNFPNHHPDPNVKDNLKKLQKCVKRNGAILGLSYDGDADRCGFVDELGNVVEADTLMAVMAEDIIKNNEEKTILCDVKCSNQLFDEIKRCGGIIYTDTPSSAKQERVMFEKNLNFGGGYSNHIFFRDRHPGYDDGIYVGLRVTEMLLKKGVTLSSLVSKLNKYYHTDEIKVKVTDENKFKIVEGVKKYADEKGYKYSTIDGVRVTKDNSWGLVRASNTGPNLTLRFESTTKKGLEDIQNEFMNILEKYK